MIVTFAVFVAFLAVVNAALVQMEPSVNTFSSTMWIRENSLTENDIIKAVFMMKHDPIAIQKFENKLLDIATPSSKNYGEWLKAEEVSSFIAPAESSVKAVLDYIATFGVTSENVRVSNNRDMIHVTMPIKTANSMFNTEFALFRSMIRRDIVLPRIIKPYSLPSEVAEVVSVVEDILRFPSIRQMPQTYGAEENPLKIGDEFGSCGTKCNGYTTPAVLQSRYGYKTVTSVASGNSMSVAEFQYQYYDHADLSNFNKNCGTSVTVDETIGGNNERICNTGCVEALLDIEYIGAIAHPIPLTVIYSSSYSLIDWINQVIDMKNPPLVHSVSYGNDEVQQTSTQYMESVNVQFMAAGSMGLSILFASGDQGVWGRTGVGKTYHPDFPAGSPYVTSVGGTDFAKKSVIGDETTWSCGGGGFSNTFSQPSWQSSAVNNYLTKAASSGVLPSSSLFNATGRAYPDVSALGGQVNPYCVAVKGGSSFMGVAGTSASCPVVAGIFAQLNNIRLAAGKPVLGWLNPFIYSNSQCFHDIADGSQNNCNAGTTGFAALSGWDPATGNGSPNYECLAKLM